ncbi:MAG: hypothetical protein H0T92_16945 [Pyrinomonadaceae bacterium]|nr:hypothetical protein [Pyrinomonadaceae bacterium]
MPEPSNYSNNSQTLAMNVDEFSFETVEQVNGLATVIRFRLQQPMIKAGDVLVVLSGTDIHFHGMILNLEDGWATASDRRDSLLPGTI